VTCVNYILCSDSGHHTLQSNSNYSQLFRLASQVYRAYKLHVIEQMSIRYDTIEEFNVDSKAEYTLQLNLAHVARN